MINFCKILQVVKKRVFKGHPPPYQGVGPKRNENFRTPCLRPYGLI